MMIVARKMTVNARCRKSFAFLPQQQRHALEAGHTVVRQLHDKRHGLAAEGVLFMMSAATMPMRMPSTYRAIITSARCVGKNAAVKNA